MENFDTHPFLAALEAGELDDEIAHGYAGGSGMQCYHDLFCWDALDMCLG